MTTSRLARCMAVSVAVLGGFATGACTKSVCSNCVDVGAATLDLACSPHDPTNVAVTGPCSAGPVVGSQVRVFGSEAGVCHVTLTFASGFIFSTEITFTVSDSCTPCVRTIAPVQASIPVNTPPSTCVEAGTLEDAGDE